MGITQVEMNALHAQIESARSLRRIADSLEEIAKILKIGVNLSPQTADNIGTKEKDDE